MHVGIGAVLAAVGLFVATHLAGGFTDAIEALQDVDPRWLVAAIACEAISYALLSWQLRYLAGHRADLPPDAALRVGLVVYGLGVITPASPAEGLVLATAELRRRGLSRRRATLALGLSEWFSMGALYLLAALNVIIAAFVGDIPTSQRTPPSEPCCGGHRSSNWPQLCSEHFDRRARVGPSKSGVQRARAGTQRPAVSSATAGTTPFFWPSPSARGSPTHCASSSPSLRRVSWWTRMCCCSRTRPV
jgi:hypothetical protein